VKLEGQVSEPGDVWKDPLTGEVLELVECESAGICLEAKADGIALGQKYETKGHGTNLAHGISANGGWTGREKDDRKHEVRRLQKVN
jgi:hypothetical protein